MYNQLVQSP